VAKLLARSGTSPSKIDVLTVNVSMLSSVPSCERERQTKRRESDLAPASLTRSITRNRLGPLRAPNISPDVLVQRASLPSRVHLQPLQVDRTQLTIPEAHPPSPVLSSYVPYVSQNTVKMNIKKEGKEKSHSPTMFMN